MKPNCGEWFDRPIFDRLTQEALPPPYILGGLGYKVKP